jgi:hypothetical protein
MLHELVHSFGFTDEYAYTQSEAPAYCVTENWPNGHTDSRANRFNSAAEAQNACVTRIPWCREAIAAGTPVTQQNADGSFIIGSPAPVSGCPTVTLGVYLGGGCQNKNPNSTWRPYFCPTAMGYPTLGEETCVVVRRHGIIGRSPNLIPPYYQKLIFNKIVFKKKLKNLNFSPSQSETVSADFRYGVPEIDRLANAQGPLPDSCQEGGADPSTLRVIIEQVEKLPETTAAANCDEPLAASDGSSQDLH